MKKTVKIAVIAIAVFLIMPITASAEEDYLGRFSELLPEEEYADFEYLSDSLSIKKIFGNISDGVALALDEIAPRLLLLLGLSVISAAASLYNGRCREGIAMGVGIITTLSAYVGIIDIFNEVTRSMEAISGFFGSLIPLFSAVTLSAGGGYTSAGQSLGMATTVSLFSGVVTPLFTAALAFMLALGLLYSFGITGTDKLMSGLKRHLLLLISVASALLVGTLSLQTLLSSAKDNAAMKVAKHLAQTTLPVVGGAVSSSLSAMWSGLSLTKGVIGVGGICVIVGMLLSPLIVLLIYRFAIGIITSAEGLLSVSSPLPRISECLDLLIGVYSISSVIYIFEIVLFIKGGVAL
jgi:stage III sporulation protein AE